MTIGLPSMDRLPRMDRLSGLERGITIADFLVPVRVAEGLGVRMRHVALILAGALLIALAAQVRFYLPGDPVPVTGQTFAVLLTGGALGFKRGATSTLLYLLLGIVGLPVFADGKHGVEIVQGVTGGYLVGFVVAAAVVGRLAEFGWDRNLLGSVGAMVIASLPIYAIGVPWLAYTAKIPVCEPAFGGGLGDVCSASSAVGLGLTPFLAGDLLKMALAAVVFPAAWWLVGRRPGDR